MNITFRKATEADRPAIDTLLTMHKLPLDGLFSDGSEYFVAFDGETFVGTAGFEFYRPDVLLRSVAVSPAHQNLGVGSQLTDFMIVTARKHGVKRIVLLTETAAGFFGRKGFRAVDRSIIDNPGILQSIEFAHACPTSAICEVLDIP